jgi:hypothetical protein
MFESAGGLPQAGEFPRAPVAATTRREARRAAEHGRFLLVRFLSRERK